MSSENFQINKKPGESLVWFSSLGLCVGICMVVAILGYIFWQGTAVFWPKQIQTVTLTAEAKTALSGKRTFAGVFSKETEAEQEDGSNKISHQYYVANKAIYQKNFIYVEQQDIASTNLNKDMMSIEPHSGSRMFLLPKKLVGPEKQEFVFTDEAAFMTALESQMEIAAGLRHQAEQMQDDKIRPLDSQEKNLNVTVEYGSENEKAEALEKLEQIELSRAEIQTDIAKITQQLLQWKFVGEDASGNEFTLPVGNVLHTFFPNRLGIGGKIAMFFHNAWTFVSTNPREANTEGGVLPAIIGTLVMTLIMIFPVTIFGVIAAIYLREYAKQGPIVRAVRIAINNLAGVPSIVFGVFGLGFFVYYLGDKVDSFFFGQYTSVNGALFKSPGVLWASLTLALMTLPVVIVATEEALAAVPRGLREGALGCGSSKWQMIWTVVLPASAPGIITGMILAMARSAGEVAPLMLVGAIKSAPSPADGGFPFLHLDQQFMHLGFHIYDLGFASPDAEAARPMVFATTLLLIAVVGVLNISGIILRQKLRKKYAGSAF